jgi:hypothetical protein
MPRRLDEDHGNLRFNRRGLTVEQVRLVFPFLDRFNRGLGEQGVALDQGGTLDIAVLVDDGS